MLETKILLCDDSALVRRKLSGALRGYGFTRLLEAADGEEAVATCAAEQPDLVLLDVLMPKKDGLEALKEIKKSHPKAIVVMASSLNTQSNLIHAAKLGADRFLQKPITAEAIIDILKTLPAKQDGA
ncbi:response regulator [Paenibacillus sp. TRM 82003]|nr:response regulator [Paenibacillus sp. TRM 82003]